MWCIKANTHPDIIDCLFTMILHWQSHHCTNHYMNRSWDDKIVDTFCHQAMLGWNFFLEGIFSKKWARLQQSYYDEINSMKSGSNWAGTLSYRLWIVVHKMWMHRNKILHEEITISDFSGSRELQQPVFTNINSIPSA